MKRSIDRNLRIRGKKVTLESSLSRLSCFRLGTGIIEAGLMIEKYGGSK